MVRKLADGGEWKYSERQFEKGTTKGPDIVREIQRIAEKQFGGIKCQGTQRRAFDCLGNPEICEPDLGRYQNQSAFLKCYRSYRSEYYLQGCTIIFQKNILGF
jgi:hypothetical protein